jgi:hypothetical protein
MQYIFVSARDLAFDSSLIVDMDPFQAAQPVDDENTGNFACSRWT